MELKVMERWGLMQLLPEQGSLATMNTVSSLRMKLATSSEEQTELEMVIGVCCSKCGNPIENQSTDENPKYFCLVCDEYVDDVKGVKDRTLWSAAKDIGKEIELNRAERRIIVQGFNKLEKVAKKAEEEGEEGGATAAQAELWRKFMETYPEKEEEGKDK